MKMKNLLILLIVTALLVALAAHRARQEQRTQPAAPGQAVFPDLDVNQVARLRIADGSVTTTVARIDGRWRIAEKYGYPADFTRLRNLLTTLADLKIGQPLHLDGATRRDLELMPPASDDAPATAGTHIELLDQQQHRMAAITIGKPFHRERDADEPAFSFQWRGADGRHVMTDAGKTFLVSETFHALSAKPGEWIDRGFIDLPSYAVLAVDITGPGRDPVALSRARSGDPWILRDMPADRELKTQQVSDLVSGLGTLRFDDVADPAMAADFNLTDESAVAVSARVDDGRQFRFLIGDAVEVAGRSLVPLRVSAAYELPAAPDADDETPAPDRAETVHRHASDIRQLNETVGSWTYLLTPETAEKLYPEQGSLLVEPPTPEPAEPAEPADAADAGDGHMEAPDDL